MGNFLCYEFGGLIHGGAYFRNFMVFHPLSFAFNVYIYFLYSFYVVSARRY